jgi:hypothetical protein
MSTLLTQLGQKVKTQLDTKLNTSGGTISGDLSISQLFELGSYTADTLPDASASGTVIYVSDGDDGNPCLAVDNGSDWKILSFGAVLTPATKLLTELGDNLTTEAGDLLTA